MNDESVRFINSGLLTRFVISKHGRWNHEDWLGLLAQVRAAGYETLPADDVGRMLEAEGENYRRQQPNDLKRLLLGGDLAAPTATDLTPSGRPLERATSRSESKAASDQEPSCLAFLIFPCVGLVLLGVLFAVLLG